MDADDEELGGDPVCWADIVDEPVPATEAPEIRSASLAELARSATRNGPAWTGLSDDLNVNLLVFAAGDGVAAHVNSEVDVLLIGIAGRGVVTVGESSHPISAGDAILIPKGTRRSTQAQNEAFSYLTCHRRRAGLWPTLAPPKQP